MQQIHRAFRYLRRSLTLARSRELRAYVLIPLAFNVLVFGTLYWISGNWLINWLDSATADWAFSGNWQWLDAVLRFLLGAVAVLIWVLLLALLASVFSLGVQILAAPFMGFLAEKVDTLHTGRPMPEESIAAMILRCFIRELRKTGYWLSRALLVLILAITLSLIPVANVLASPLWFIWSGWLLGVLYIDFAADNRQVPFSQMRQRLGRKPLLVTSFGSAVLALTMLPLVNLVIMPIAVIAGTLIWTEEFS